MATYPILCSPCVTYRTLCHAIGHQVLPNPLDAYESFLPLLNVTGTPPWLLRPVRTSTSSELYPHTWWLFLFFNSVTCDLGKATHPTPLPREVEDFPRGDKYFKHVPLPTYLIYLPEDLYRQVLFKLYDRLNL